MARRQPQPSVQELTEQGLRQFRAVDAAAARRTFEAVLARAPEHLAALSMLGLLAMQSGAYALAVPLFERATQAAPGVWHHQSGCPVDGRTSGNSEG